MNIGQNAHLELDDWDKNNFVNLSLEAFDLINDE